MARNKPPRVSELLLAAIEADTRSLAQISADAGVPYPVLYGFARSGRKITIPHVDSLAAELLAEELAGIEPRKAPELGVNEIPIHAACERVLSRAKKPIDVNEILRRLQLAGFEGAGRRAYNSLHQAMARRPGEFKSTEGAWELVR